MSTSAKNEEHATIKDGSVHVSRELTPESKDTITRNWRTPSVMLAALLAGLAIALAHHFMNVSLNNKVVTEIKLSQAWVSRFGIALAYLVKVCFGICVGVAFVQRQWLDMQCHSHKVEEIDKITGVLENALGFLSFVWFRNRSLALVAIISWLIPLVSVSTPGSLSVQPVATLNHTSLQIPRLNYNTTGFGYVGFAQDTALITQNAIYKLAYLTGYSGQIANVPSKFANQSYHLIFHGPAIKCGETNDSRSVNATNTFGYTYGAIAATRFAAWAGNTRPSQIKSILDPSYLFNSNIDGDSADAARLFVASNTFNGLSIDINGSQVVLANITECLLYNATYSTDFVFQYPNQTIKSEISAWLNPVSANQSEYIHSEQQVDRFHVAYLAIMQAFNTLLIGYDSWDAIHVQAQTGTGSYRRMNIDWTRSEMTRFGLEQLFQNLTLGFFSDSTLLMNTTDVDYIPVTISEWPNTYVYDSVDLLIAYGLGVLASILCCFVGMYAFITNKASYQNSFSSFIRATHQNLAPLVDDNDAGMDPLPISLAKVEIVMGNRVRQGEAGF